MREIQDMKREIAIENDIEFDKCDTANLSEITIDLEQIIRRMFSTLCLRIDSH